MDILANTRWDFIGLSSDTKPTPATVGQIKMGVLSTTPTGTTAGFPGRLYTYDSGGGTYEVYLCVHDNGDDTYVWKKVSLI